MTNRHFYKHRVTGIVAALNDSFAAVFGDRFERVEAPAKAETPDTSTTPVAPETEAPVAAESTAANPQNVTTDSVKEG